MTKDFNKPLYAEYRKQMILRFFWGLPVISEEKSYRLADIPFVAVGRVLIIIAFGVIGWLNPFLNYYSHFEYSLRFHPFETAIIYLILIIIATALYKYIFVYRFGRFRVTWEDGELHPYEEASSRCDENGKFLKNEENRKAARRSRRAFLVLFAGIIAAVLLYCFLWVGLSYLRVPILHSGEIEEVKQIAQKYEHVHCDVGFFGSYTGSGDDMMSLQDGKRLNEIYLSMHWDYVVDISCHDFGKRIRIVIKTPFGLSQLLWYKDIADTSEVKRFPDIVTQLDEHWFYVSKYEGRFF